MKAKQWYSRFRRGYDDDRTIRKIENNGKYDEEGVWTPAVMALLRRMGENLGCAVTEEEGTAGRCRSDQRWIKDNGSVVCIEHENRCDDKIQGEIRKLCNDVSKLKVLITYVADRNFDENVNRLKAKIEEIIHGCRATFSGEFLLVVSGYHEKDWEAHISRLKLEPLNVKGGQA